MAQNNPEIDPHKYAQLIFDKGTKDSSIKRVFSTNNIGIIRPTPLPKHLYLSLSIKKLTKWITNLNVKL